MSGDRCQSKFWDHSGGVWCNSASGGNSGNDGGGVDDSGNSGVGVDVSGDGVGGVDDSGNDGGGVKDSGNGGGGVDVSGDGGSGVSDSGDGGGGVDDSGDGGGGVCRNDSGSSRDVGRGIALPLKLGMRPSRLCCSNTDCNGDSCCACVNDNSCVDDGVNGRNNDRDDRDDRDDCIDRDDCDNSCCRMANRVDWDVCVGEPAGCKEYNGWVDCIISL